MTDRKKQGLLLLSSFLVFAALAALFPYTGDDWDWGSRIGMERLTALFADYNGRYLGNLLVIAQTRVRVLDVLMKAACCTLVPLLCTRYSRKGDALTLAFAGALLLIMPRGIFAQSIVWTAGFVNYVPSALISGAYLLALKNADGQTPESGKPGFFWGSFLLGLLGAWFMENITVFNILLGLAALVWLWWKHRRIPSAYLGFPLGAILGAAAMFANSGYRVIAQGEDFYRQTPQGLLDTVKFMADNLQKILGSLILDNWAMCLVISAVLLVLAARGRKTEAVRFWAVAHGLSLLPVLAGKPLLGIAAPHFPEEAALAVQIGITLLAAVPYVVTVFVLSWLVTEPSGRFPLLLPLICVPLCMGPLLVVRPIGDRCMFPGYLLLMLFTVGLLDLLRIRGPFPTEKKALTVLTVVLALQMVHLFGVYSPIHARNQAMNAYARIQSEAGATVIRITDLSEDGYVHCSYPYNEIWWNRYCLYYGLNTDTYFELVPQEEFMAEAREVLGR